MTTKLTKPTNAASSVAMMVKEFYNGRYKVYVCGNNYYLETYTYNKTKFKDRMLVSEKITTDLITPTLYGDAKGDKVEIPAAKKHLAIVKKWFNDKRNINPETGLAMLSPQNIEKWIEAIKYREARMTSIDSYRMLEAATSKRYIHIPGQNPWIDYAHWKYCQPVEADAIINSLYTVK